ncbi:hypothetical protein V6R21_11570 [Limibacter armeniacum]|uniref:hypothetical protein n=1 Tax=Limibacter armeniacum TaxID=466084 RepID=UPI002FE60346
MSKISPKEIDQLFHDYIGTREFEGQTPKARQAAFLMYQNNRNKARKPKAK